MTDHERAVAFARAAIGEAEVGTTDLLVAEFAAVRREERAKYVALVGGADYLLMTHAAYRSEAGEGACDCDACTLFRPLVEALS